MNTHQLKLNGYDATDGRITCARETPHDKHSQERVAIIRLDLERDSKVGREIVDALLAAADSPRALSARDRRGGAVLLFRLDGERNIIPSWPGYAGNVFKLMGRDNTAITLTFGSVGLSLDVDAYSWPKGRSPLDVERDRLPELTLDVSQAVVDAAFAAGCSWAPTQAEINSERERDARLAKILADAEAGKINLNPTAADLAEEADAKLVADNEGRDLAPNDGLFSVLILEARRRLARRKSQAA